MPDVHKSEKLIFCEAVELPADQRGAFLDSACGDDAGLRAGVEALLQEHEQSHNLLDVSHAGATVDMPRGESPGTQIGPYKLLQEVGEGGMGVVYMAEQTEPVKRRVALKVIKPGMDSRQVIARFEAERQALALMDHPNVARVFDAGTTEEGRPYFAMELVKGIPITRYCDQNHLPTRDRLDLFIQVCEAVQHAHHKGIIHRDLKPSNVLVAEYDGRPVPKIIDFGVAKALNQSLTDKTMFTQFGQIVGTLEYMSPEQSRFNQLDVDTRSDVYSLGVLLYELLSGATPFDRERLRTTAFDEVLRIIGEEEPPKPSTRLMMSETLPAVAAGRATDAKHLPGLVRGDLDWIVMKALSKDRGDRYQTPSALADDIRRHLEYRPIEARRPSVVGRLRRFAKRNRSAVTFGTGTVLAVCAAVGLGLYAIHQRRQRIEGQQQQQAELEQRDMREATRLRVEAARSQLSGIHQLMEAGLVVAAYQRALDVREDLPADDAQFAALWDELTRPLTIETNPPGATVSIRDWDHPDGKWIVLGETPLNEWPIPRKSVRWKLDKEGYTSRQMLRAFSSNEQVNHRLLQAPPNGPPTDMVVIFPYGGVKNARYLPIEDAFLMDRYEVTNAEFQEFIEAGGYENAEYWQYEFVRDGETITREEALATFVDQTGMPGPSTWENGLFPPGREDYPVHGVSWYEAAAYAEFRGKALPTIHHWYAASYASAFAKYIVPHSNFGDAPAPVGRYDGIGVYDLYDLAGNVAEWCFNESATGPGVRSLRGGAWDDPDYMFMAPDLGQAMDRLPRYGFRCVSYPDENDSSDKLLSPVHNRAPTFDAPPVSDEVMKVILSRFDVDPNQSLNDQLISSVDHGTCRHDTVQIDAAYGDERFDVHLYVPVAAQPPYETVVWVPGTGAFNSTSFEGRRDQTEVQFQDELLATGRAVCLPVCQEMYGRKTGNTSRIDAHVQRVRDVRRTVDYLWSHPEQFDRHRLIYSGFSFGASHGPIFCVAEERIAAAVLINGGYQGWARPDRRPEADPYNFCSRVRIPVLMINGRFDPIFPVRETQEPFFEDLGTPDEDKKLIHFDGGHSVPSKEAVAQMDAWLKSKLLPRE